MQQEHKRLEEWLKKECRKPVLKAEREAGDVCGEETEEDIPREDTRKSGHGKPRRRHFSMIVLSLPNNAIQRSRKNSQRCSWILAKITYDPGVTVKGCDRRLDPVD